MLTAILKILFSSLHKSLRDKKISNLTVTQELGRYEFPIYHLSKRKNPYVALCGEDTLKTMFSITDFPIKSKDKNCEKCAKYRLGGAG